MAARDVELDRERAMKDQFMAGHPESPFVVGEVGPFRGLRYFAFDPTYRVEARLERLPKPEEAVLRTNRDGQLVCRYIGDIHFALDGQELALRVYHAGEQVGPSVFIPFRDATCGNESYEAGRYLILQLTEDDRYTLDFNLAFNPYCAYTDRFECGFPPAENDLPLPVRAGEMAWSPDAEPPPAEAASPASARAPPPPPRAPAARTPSAPAAPKSRSKPVPKPLARAPKGRPAAPPRGAKVSRKTPRRTKSS